jgi:hypothetical protein
MPRRIGLGFAMISLTWSCRGSPTSIVTVADTFNVAGTWAGAERDRLGSALLTWNLVQHGSAISGTALIRPTDPSDGTCASCHKSKDGTVSGTVSGKSIMLTMFFAAGGSADPTPACSITLISKGLGVTETAIVGTYSGTDPCEASFDGSLSMFRNTTAVPSTRKIMPNGK